MTSVPPQGGSTGLTGAVAIVTGASSGIGRAYTRALAAQGCRLVLVGRRRGALESVAGSLADGGSGPAEVEIVVGDVAEPATNRAAVEAAVARFGTIDIVLANAGLYLGGDLVNSSVEAIGELVSVNVFGAMAVVREALPHLVHAGRGDIFFTSSVSGHQALHWEPVYSATKHAIQGFAQSLRRQLVGTGVRVGAIAPGVVLNELWGYGPDDERSDDAVATARGITSEDVAEAMLFMLTRPRHVSIRDLVILPTDQEI